MARNARHSPHCACVQRESKDLQDSLFTTYQLEGDVMPGLLTGVPKKGKGYTDSWNYLYHSINCYLHSEASVADVEDVQQAYVKCVGKLSHHTPAAYLLHDAQCHEITFCCS